MQILNQGLERGLSPAFLISPQVRVIQLIHTRTTHGSLKSDTRVQMPTLDLGSCVTLGKLINISELSVIFTLMRLHT